MAKKGLEDAIRYFTANIREQMTMNKEFKKGDKVLYNHKKYKIHYVSPHARTIYCNIENDNTILRVAFNDLTRYVESPTVRDHAKEAVDQFHRNMTTIGMGQLELEFGELTGDLPEFTKKEVTNDLYCSCSIPEVIRNQAYGNSFLFCKGCRKERI